MSSSDALHWTETDSQTFVDYGRYFVPDRELQIQTICALIPPQPTPFQVLELCCGEGLLGEAILQSHPQATWFGYDGSLEMLAQTKERLQLYNGRFHTHLFDLAATDWRTQPDTFHAIVSSLAIHHLDSHEKQQLFQDVYRLLASGGVFLVADVVQPTQAQGVKIAAETWDSAVQQRTVVLDGNLHTFDYFRREKWNLYHYPDPMDKPSSLFEQLKWMEQIGFCGVDVYWMKAGHALFGGQK